MSIYQLKPVYVEAHQVTIDNLEEMAEWCNGKILFINMMRGARQVELNKESGYTRAEIGDWIVKESAFHFRAYSPDGFDRKYIHVGDRS